LLGAGGVGLKIVIWLKFRIPCVEVKTVLIEARVVLPSVSVGVRNTKLRFRVVAPQPCHWRLALKIAFLDVGESDPGTNNRAAVHDVRFGVQRVVPNDERVLGGHTGVEAIGGGGRGKLDVLVSQIHALGVRLASPSHEPNVPLP
jgi:hypothetical protein